MRTKALITGILSLLMACEAATKKESPTETHVQREAAQPTFVEPVISKCMIQEYTPYLYCDSRHLEKVVFNFETEEWENHGQYFYCEENPFDFLSMIYESVEYDPTIYYEELGAGLGLNTWTPTESDVRISVDSLTCLVDGAGPYGCSSTPERGFQIFVKDELLQELNLIFEDCN